MENVTGWTFERFSSDRVDDHGFLVAEPTNNAEFVCHDHDFATGVLSVQQAGEGARTHFAERHPGEDNPFGEAS